MKVFVVLSFLFLSSLVFAKEISIKDAKEETGHSLRLRKAYMHTKQVCKPHLQSMNRKKPSAKIYPKGQTQYSGSTAGNKNQ